MSISDAARRRPFLRLNAVDFFADDEVQRLTPEHQGLYLRALLRSWLTDTPGVARHDVWGRWMGFTAETWTGLRGLFWPCFSGEIDGIWTQKRLVREHELSTERSRHGTAAVTARWTKAAQKNTGVIPNDTRGERGEEDSSLRSESLSGSLRSPDVGGVVDNSNYNDHGVYPRAGAPARAREGGSGDAGAGVDHGPSEAGDPEPARDGRALAAGPGPGDREDSGCVLARPVSMCQGDASEKAQQLEITEVTGGEGGEAAGLGRQELGEGPAEAVGGQRRSDPAGVAGAVRGHAERNGHAAAAGGREADDDRAGGSGGRDRGPTGESRPREHPRAHVAARDRVSPGDEFSAGEWEEAFRPEFYDRYPRKVAPAVALRAWMKIRPKTHEQFNTIMQGLHRHLRVYETREREKIPHPATWLNQRRWEGEA